MERSTALRALLGDSHLIVPDHLPVLVQEHARPLGAGAAVVFLADLDQRSLRPLVPPGWPPLGAVRIDGTLAGRCFRTMEVVEADVDGHRTQWIPLLDGAERLGVLQLLFDGDPPATDADLKEYAGLIAELLVSKSAYGDFIELARRTQPLTIGSELLWQLLPPLTYGTGDLVIVAGLIPTERLGGDAFDYGVDHERVQLAIFDAIGHDLRAGLLATTAVAAFRNARRSRFDLARASEHIGSAISEHFDDSTFVTGIVGSLELSSGVLSWCVAGHPAPLLVRDGRVVKHLDHGRGQPFGIGPASEVLTEQLEAGDCVLFFTDGVTEARDEAGRFFELETLIDLVSRTSKTVPLPETMRLLMHAIEAHNHGPLRDDATVLLVEWRGQGSELLEL